MSEQPMSEQPLAEDPTAEDPAAEQPVAEQPVAEPLVAEPKKPRRFTRRTLITLAASVAAFALIAGGVGFTAVTVQNADRDPGKPTWRFPETDAKDPGDSADSGSTRASGLKGMLLPYGTQGSGRGPDLGGFGTDEELNGRRATEMRKESVQGLPRSQRRTMERLIDKQRIQGIVMRSYTSTDKTFTVSIVLSRIENRSAVRSGFAGQKAFFEAVDVFRKGPKIEGHKNALCYLMPKGKKYDIDMMMCSAYVGDVLVSATAHGGQPLDAKGVTGLFREQLDRIDSPGEAV
ncbi:hypothetical protein ACFVT5_12520 [Streptomyces sp. NPDC058001]|uniref:hypothetical protein n=1 Tax=Streptomyces sp. NPDC058001 TaxID=3346300 RepID=UPI0036E9F437